METVKVLVPIVVAERCAEHGKILCGYIRSSGSDLSDYECKLFEKLLLSYTLDDNGLATVERCDECKAATIAG